MLTQAPELIVDEVPTAQAEALGLRSGVPGFRAYLLWTTDRNRPADIGYVWEIINGWVARYDAAQPRMLPHAYLTADDAVQALMNEDRSHLHAC